MKIEVPDELLNILCSFDQNIKIAMNALR